MKRLTGLLLLMMFFAIADGYKQLAWVKVDEKAGLVLSNGAKAGQELKPGQFVALRNGGYQALPQWRPPQDIEKLYTGNMRRVVFSHERHFAALGAKHCETCHADEKGLGKTTDWKSLAPGPDLEPHKSSSLGRFCATCHDGSTSVKQLPETNPPVALKIFSAMGKAGGSCDRCHAPASHGSDFTAMHGEFAEDGGNCTACHRGGASISQRDWGQAAAFIAAQLELAKNSEDADAFKKTLPNNFCSYCHAADKELWQVRP